MDFAWRIQKSLPRALASYKLLLAIAGALLITLVVGKLSPLFEPRALTEALWP